jgi:hypothetical protein
MSNNIKLLHTLNKKQEILTLVDVYLMKLRTITVLEQSIILIDIKI